jgi:hypothetical protein
MVVEQEKTTAPKTEHFKTDTTPLLMRRKEFLLFCRTILIGYILESLKGGIILNSIKNLSKGSSSETRSIDGVKVSPPPSPSPRK